MTGKITNGGSKVSLEVTKKSPDLSIWQKGIFNFSKISFDRQLIRLAGLSGAIAVGLGAYGSHGKDN